jgi:hypothetical protein
VVAHLLRLPLGGDEPDAPDAVVLVLAVPVDLEDQAVVGEVDPAKCAPSGIALAGGVWGKGDDRVETPQQGEDVLRDGHGGAPWMRGTPPAS